ncbi:MAG: mechanosensitive ion channel family protein [Rhodobiaceae bacterium]|nr:mechanosensitive ion channel family protein [Rhodobiaceae bacterium]
MTARPLSLPRKLGKRLCAILLLAMLGLTAAGPWQAQAQDQATQQPAPSPAQPGAASQPADSQSGGDVESETAGTGTQESKLESRTESAPAKPARIAAAQIDEQRDKVNAWKASVDRIEAALRRDSDNDKELADLRREMEPIRNEAPAIIALLQDRVRIIEERIAQLGEAPANGAPAEAPAVQAEREALNAALADVRGVLTQAKVIQVQAEQLEARISERRRDRFAARLTERNQPPYDPTLLRDVFVQFPQVLGRFGLLMTEGVRATLTNVTPSEDRPAAGINFRLSIIVIAIGVSIAILIGGRRKLAQLYRRVPRDSEPGRLEKFAGATWLVIIDALVPLISLFMVLVAVRTSGFLPDRLLALVSSATAGLGFYLFLRAVIIAVLAPRVPSWRLFKMQQDAALNLIRVLLVMSALVGLDKFLDKAFNLVAAPLQIDIARSGWFAVIFAFLGIAALRLIVQARSEPTESGDADLFGTANAETVAKPWTWLRILYWFLFLGIAASGLTGYVALASYSSTHVALASAIVTLAAILIIFTDELSTVLINDTHGPTQALARNFGFSRSAMDQLIVVISGLFRLFLIITTAVLVMVPWGFDTWQWSNWVRSAFFGVQVGEINISPSVILSAITVFAVGLVATRAIRNWLDNKYLPRTNLDVGLKSSVSTALGYVGVVIAAAVAVSFAGFDLANLAIVAGALSLGIGFGLQSIVNNFVSGLILLAERPVKVGDWIQVGGEQGNVRRISVRATEIQTFDRATVIVPNSDLISGQVKNMMLVDRTGRATINIGVSYDSDADKVHDILIEIAKAHPGVLAFPEPAAYFVDFGASSLDFRLYAYLANVDNILSVSSDLRYAILKRFRDEGIEIPFPQSDIHVRGDVSVATSTPGSRKKT